MIACPSCGFEASDDFAFCPRCATALTPPRAAVEERKIVTTLFCDLVAFTAMSEAADPEDVDALLGDYFARATKVIESHGGTVEKFIGDAVVGVFGVPAVHEDDSERAVRAGLRLIEALKGMTRPDGTPLEARCGVNTGEALVRLDVDPASGRGFITGDAVNTAARLEAATPPGAVAVGALTHELTARAIEYEELPPVSAKGKAEPVAAWLAKCPVSRMGVDVDRAELTPLVGREVELGFLRALLEKAVASETPQFTLILGEPGIGKSRLIRELFAYVDQRPVVMTWRQGRCLPYGENVTFWALAEIVKAHAGILDSESMEGTETKLDAVLPEGADREWFRQRLRALIGLDAPAASRDENFAAWLHFLEEIAAAHPTVLVFEDLHLADEALLAFIEHLTTHADAVPLLVLAAARPELFEKHPMFLAGSAHVNRVSVGSLTPDESQQLIAGLRGDVGTLTHEVAHIVASCEGNPFFVEQSAQLLAERVQGEPIPASVQAVLAARLDALLPVQKVVLADAAVVGSVFWDGAVACLGRRDTVDVDAALRDLIAKQLVRRVRRSSMAGENEFAFTHTLAREVAYQELPRAARAKRHANLADWLERRAGERTEDLAEIIAHHYTTALDLARAAGSTDLADSLVEPAVHSLALAGSRAINLDIAAAERHFERALQLAGAASAERPALLVRWAEALRWRSRFREAADALQEALLEVEAAGDARLAAKTMVRLADVGSVLHDRTFSADLIVQAMKVLEDDGPSLEKAEVLATWGAYLWSCEDDLYGAIRAQEQAIDMCERLGLPEPVDALGMAAEARCELGDTRGLDDYRHAVTAAEAQGLGAELAQLQENFGAILRAFQGPRAARGVHSEGLALARRRGIEASVLALSVELIADCEALGEWDEAMASAADLAPQLEDAEDVWDLLQLRPLQALLFVRRGEARQAEPFLAWLTERGRESEVGFLRTYAMLTASAVHHAIGSVGVARDLLAEWAAMPHGRGKPTHYVELVPEAVRSALAAGDSDLAVRLGEAIEPVWPVGEHALATVSALLAEDRAQHTEGVSAFVDAAARWSGFGVPYEEAQALLGQARCLVALGRVPEAAVPLTKARKIFARLGATPALDEIESLLSEVGEVVARSSD